MGYEKFNAFFIVGHLVESAAAKAFAGKIIEPRPAALKEGSGAGINGFGFAGERYPRRDHQAQEESLEEKTWPRLPGFWRWFHCDAG